MERIYFGINEEGARIAHDMMSFRDYREGSKTIEYQSMVDFAYEIAEKIIEKKPDEKERVERLCERYSRRLAQNFNKDIQIGMMCPSVMISGPGKFPVKKKEKQIKAWEKNREDYTKIQEILDKIKNICDMRDIIKSNDENVIEKLEERVEELREKQEQMKEANKAIRMKDIEKGDEILRNMGYTDEKIIGLRTPDFCGRIGYPSYLLTNNNSNIRRLEARMRSLKVTKGRGNQESKNKFFKIKEDVEAMRIQLIFEEKPQLEVREILKRNGFRWAPSIGVWQRQLNSNGQLAVQRVIQELERA